MRLLQLLLVMFVCAAGPAVAGPLEDDAAYKKGDYATALRLMRSLADQGHATAQYNLGLMYDNGQGVPQDYAAATSWYRKAAAQGNADAQNSLGIMYAISRGVPQDFEQAHMWFNLAAAKGRGKVASMVTPTQIEEAQKLAREWKPKQ
jgi:TPR repeat protein